MKTVETNQKSDIIVSYDLFDKTKEKRIKDASLYWFL